MRVAKELKEGMYVNLGIGLPTLVANFIAEEAEVFLHSENGILGYGMVLEDENEGDFDLVNAGGQLVTIRKGACFFDSALSFGMIRGGHIDVAVLGAFQVSEEGDLANWALSDSEITGVGGAMDVCYGSKRIFVAMEHCSRDGKPKIVKKCTFPLTATGIVDKIFTDLAVIDVSPKGLILREVAPSVSIEEILGLTEARLMVPSDVKEISL